MEVRYDTFAYFVFRVSLSCTPDGPGLDGRRNTFPVARPLAITCDHPIHMHFLSTCRHRHHQAPTADTLVRIRQRSTNDVVAHQLLYFERRWGQRPTTHSFHRHLQVNHGLALLPGRRAHHHRGQDADAGCTINSGGRADRGNPRGGGRDCPLLQLMMGVDPVVLSRGNWARARSSLLLACPSRENYDKGTLAIARNNFMNSPLQRFGLEDCNSSHAGMQVGDLEQASRRIHSVAADIQHAWQWHPSYG